MKKLLAILSLFFCMTVTLMAQQVVTTWLSDAVVPGEQTRLFIIPVSYTHLTLPTT